MGENEKRGIRNRTVNVSIELWKLYYKGGKSYNGKEKIFYKLLRKILLETLSKDVIECIKRCQQCQSTNKNAKQPELEHVEVQSSSWQKIDIDLIGPLNDEKRQPLSANGSLNDEKEKPLSDNGCRYVQIDYFSNYLKTFPLKRKLDSDVDDRLYDLFCKQGVPLELINDTRREFTSLLTETKQSKYEYKHILITSHHPQSKSKCERIKQTRKGMMNTFVQDNVLKWERLFCLQHFKAVKF
ncbi:unnamed protein product [Mytilus coruscus]|uniref:Integrase catalytic domain-containing protein n=1 Tax=Mytilus coruscus TaxID=42192 RepID=A0A6J8C9R6_MYTCO|nr:unnamed protein product [Mytilus coruscus]